MAKILIGNIKGPKGDTGPQGPQGEIGPQGPQGPLPPLVNNALATTAGVAALDAAMGKTLNDRIDTTNSNLVTLTNAKITGELNRLSKVEFGRTSANDGVYIRFYVSTAQFYQIEFLDGGKLVLSQNNNGTWTTLWTK